MTAAAFPSDATVNVTDCTISSVFANRGGGIANLCLLRLTNSTISHNRGGTLTEMPIVFLDTGLQPGRKPLTHSTKAFIAESTDRFRDSE